MIIYILLFLAFAWLLALELRHNGVKGLAEDSKTLAQQAMKEARKLTTRIRDK
jgi:hypothetical protein